MNIEIKEASKDIKNIKILFTEYTTGLGIDLSYQQYDKEFSNLPGDYSPPEGRLYIAYVNKDPAGCIALRKLDTENCEMKRLYVREQYRRLKIGKLLIEALLSDAIKTGYKYMFLDTLHTMISAINMYRKFGFKETAPYYESPLEETIYMKKKLV